MLTATRKNKPIASNSARYLPKNVERFDFMVKTPELVEQLTLDAAFDAAMTVVLAICCVAAVWSAPTYPEPPQGGGLIRSASRRTALFLRAGQNGFLPQRWPRIAGRRFHDDRSARRHESGCKHGLQIAGP